MPGLIDPHMHFVFTAIEDWINVSPITTADFTSVWMKLREGVAKAKEGEWIRAQQFDPSITRGARVPALAELDALAPNNPFFMQESNGHVAYANSAAFKLVGITRNTPDPKGARFVRDQNGTLTGRLEEAAAQQPFFEKMPQPNAAEMMARTRRLIQQAASVGCTMLHDCGIGLLAGVNDVALLETVTANDSPVRYRGMLVSTNMDDWEKARFKPGYGKGVFQVDGIKAWADGSNQALTGYGQAVLGSQPVVEHSRTNLSRTQELQGLPGSEDRPDDAEAYPTKMLNKIESQDGVIFHDQHAACRHLHAPRTRKRLQTHSRGERSSQKQKTRCIIWSVRRERQWPRLAPTAPQSAAIDAPRHSAGNERS
jgi:hypothetical protein